MSRAPALRLRRKDRWGAVVNMVISFIPVVVFAVSIGAIGCASSQNPVTSTSSGVDVVRDAPYSIRIGGEPGSGRYGFVDRAGNTLIPPIYDDPMPDNPRYHFSEGLAAVRLDGLWTYIDATGKTVIETEFTQPGDFHDGLAAIGNYGLGELRGYIDKTGRVVIPLRFDDAGDFSEGLAGVRIGGSWGFIDTGGEWAVTPRF